MAHPRKVVTDELGDVAVFVDTLRWHRVDECKLGLSTPDDNVLDNLALRAGLGETILVGNTDVLHGLSLLVAHALRGVEEVVQANDCYLLLARVGRMPTLFSEGTSLDAFTAP